MDGLANGASASQQKTARLKELFQDVDPIEITGSLDLCNKSPLEIAALLPSFTTIQEAGGNPAFGLLFDPKTRRVWSLRSGFSPHFEESVKGIRFKSGIMTREVAQSAGAPWWDDRVPLGAHIEGQAAAFMRKANMTDAVLYINSAAPCKWDGRGCMFNLPELLAAGATFVVFNKNGKTFSFTGLPD